MQPSPESNPIRVVVVDDHVGIREGLRVMLDAAGGFSICGEAENAAQALGVIATRAPDIAIIDISLKGPVHGLELTRQLRHLHPKVAILVLSLHAEAEFAVGAITAGAGGYLSKSEAGEYLPEALRAILEGEIYATPEMREKMERSEQALTSLDARSKKP